MFDLEKREFYIIIFLIFCLLLGLGVAAYKMHGPHLRLETLKFNVEEFGSAEPAFARKPININEAGPEELMRLEGIGRTLAERIIEYRSREGRFSRASDIKNVKGIGEKLFDAIKDDIAVE